MSTLNNLQNDVNSGGIGGDTVPANDQIPRLTALPGFLTSQGQLTAIVTVVFIILSMFGIAYKQSSVDSYVGLIQNLIQVLGPVIALSFTAIAYINSRGKIQSNLINANADIHKVALAQSNNGTIPGLSLSTLASSANVGLLPPIEEKDLSYLKASPIIDEGIHTPASLMSTQRGIASIPGFGSVKDPNTYIKIGKIIGSLIPSIGKVTNHLNPDDPSDYVEFKTDVVNNLNQIGANEANLNTRLSDMEKRMQTVYDKIGLPNQS